MNISYGTHSGTQGEFSGQQDDADLGGEFVAVIYPVYRVEVPGWLQQSLPGVEPKSTTEKTASWGHAGFMVIDDANFASYYEWGRYDAYTKGKRGLILSSAKNGATKTSWSDGLNSGPIPKRRRLFPIRRGYNNT